ncbi:hypothetical protein [Magnetospirillum sp. 64-120]|uniref:hypothetical protein n=1 Tax=Magnetospirillum sp. 64-120 TaxID=1895778 RepID=UPI0025BE6BB2|nr:hypothetical protein [Magnetospirillum sp. 64-120]
MAEADAVRERYVYSAPWLMAYCLFFWPVYVVFLFAISGGMFAAAFSAQWCVLRMSFLRGKGCCATEAAN